MRCGVASNLVLLVGVVDFLSIYENAFRYQNMGWAAAISMVLFIIILIITIIQFKFLQTDWEY